MPKSNSWFPSAAAVTPSALYTSVTLLPWKRFEISVPWKASPASRTMTAPPCSFASARMASRYPPNQSAPPISLSVLEAIHFGAATSSRAPCVSLIATIVSLCPSEGTAAFAGDGAQASAATRNGDRGRIAEVVTMPQPPDAPHRGRHELRIVSPDPVLCLGHARGSCGQPGRGRAPGGARCRYPGPGCGGPRRGRVPDRRGDAGAPRRGGGALRGAQGRRRGECPDRRGRHLGGAGSRGRRDGRRAGAGRARAGAASGAVLVPQRRAGRAARGGAKGWS